MEKRTNKKPVKRSRVSQKQKTVQSFLILTIILFLCIVLVYLIPEKINRGEKVIHLESGKEERGEDKGDKKDITPHIENHDETYTYIDEMGVVEDKEKHGKIVVVIDDAGNNIKDLLPFLQFPGKLSIAVLPRLAYSTEAANLIYEAGKEVLLHLPMEANHDIYPGPGTLYSEDTKEEIIQKLKENLDTVPWAVGANNHMGSKLTADPEKMGIIFRFFYKQNLYFLDSRTTSDSVCRETASMLGMPLLERHIFLDYKVDKEVIREQMKKGIALAGKNKYVILIGHVQNEEVLDVLYEFLPELEQNHYAFTGLSEIYGK